MKVPRIIVRDQAHDFGLQLFQASEAAPRQVSLQVLPHSLGRVQFRDVRLLEQQNDILWDAQLLLRMTPAVVQQQHVERVGPRLRELVQKHLELSRVELRHPQEIAITPGRRNRAVQMEVAEALLELADGLRATRRDAAAPNRVQPQAALVVGPDLSIQLSQNGTVPRGSTGLRLTRLNLFKPSTNLWLVLLMEMADKIM